jgi:hypothetical protein
MNATTMDAKPTATRPFWSVAMVDIMLRDAKPEQATENMFKRVEASSPNTQSKKAER